eukprot:6210739-Pleurochrysis_carterae.AAC.1
MLTSWPIRSPSFTRFLRLRAVPALEPIIASTHCKRRLPAQTLVRTPAASCQPGPWLVPQRPLAEAAAVRAVACSALEAMALTKRMEQKGAIAVVFVHFVRLFCAWQRSAVVL